MCVSCACFTPAGHLLLDHQLLGPALTAKLSLAASYCCTNLQLLSVQHLVTAILPQHPLLPQHWQRAAAVHWDAAADGSTQAVAADGSTASNLVTW
jgi:hypothetical protein